MACRVSGADVVTVSTRPEPQPYAGGRVFHVYPPGHTGQKIEPAFEGLMCAYNFWCAGTDWATSGRPRVRPGDTILVHAGVYQYNRFEYTNDAKVNRTVPLDGTYYLTADGTEDMPIAIKAAGDGAVVFDGAGNFALFDVRAADYTYFEGITFRNAEIAIQAGTQFIAGAKGLTVKRSRFENVGAGVFTNFAGSSNFYIADNTFIGRNDPNHLIGWNGEYWTKFNGVEGQIFPPKMASYVAVKLYGPGHVVAYNYIADFHDGINVETYGNPDGSYASGPGIVEGPKYPTREYWDRRPVAIDFYNNYITNSHDNPIEADGSMHNIRIMRNMLINHASHAFCNQPTLGGPVYWIRNIAYNLPGGAVRLTNGAAGAIFYNNTILSETHGAGRVEHSLAQQSDARSELGAGDSERQHVHQLHLVRLQRVPAESWCEGVVPVELAAGRDGRGLHRAWSQRASSRAARSPRSPSTARRRGRTRTASPWTTTSSSTCGGSMRRTRRTCRSCTRPPTSTSASKPGSAAVDRGIALPTVTDGFAGSAPDLGALEVGKPLPHYGPR